MYLPDEYSELLVDNEWNRVFFEKPKEFSKQEKKLGFKIWRKFL